MFGHKDTEHLGEVKHGFLHSVPIDQVKVGPIQYVFVVEEGASNLAAPIFHEGGAGRACDLLFFNFDSDLFEGEFAVDVFVVIDARDKDDSGKPIHNDVDFLSNSQLMPFLLLVLM